MVSGPKKFFIDFEDTVESYYGQLRFRRMGNGFHNSTIKRIEILPEELADTYKKLNENRSLGSIAYYDSEMGVIWWLDGNPDENHFRIYISQLPKSWRLYCGVKKCPQQV